MLACDFSRRSFYTYIYIDNCCAAAVVATFSVSSIVVVCHVSYKLAVPRLPKNPSNGFSAPSFRVHIEYSYPATGLVHNLFKRLYSPLAGSVPYAAFFFFFHLLSAVPVPSGAHA